MPATSDSRKTTRSRDTFDRQPHEWHFTTVLTTPGVMLWVICLCASTGLVVMVMAGYTRLPALGLYGLACISAVLALGRNWRWPGRIRPNPLDIAIPAMLIIMQLLALYRVSSVPHHHVQDEFITAYTSLTLPRISEIDWFGGYPASGEWLAQFPILFHALQWSFFAVLGASVDVIRISTWPYHLLTTLCLYLLGRELLHDRRWASAIAAVYIVLAPNLYLAGSGLHFISSTAFFTAALTGFVFTISRRHSAFAVLCGVFSVAAYLTYVSSYLTLPVLLLLSLLVVLRQRSVRPLQLLAPALVVFVIGILPFATYALTQNNYFWDRPEQVSLTEADEDTNDLASHLLTSVRSLYIGDIGGVNDYWFGMRPLFDPATLGLLIVGMLAAVYRGIRHGETLLLGLVPIVLGTFVLGMVLTTPAGAFHRVSLAFPFVAFLIVLGIRSITSGIATLSGRPILNEITATVIVAAMVAVNIFNGAAMIQGDADIRPVDGARIARYLDEHVPEGSRVVIAAFPNYHLERELTFRSRQTFTFETLEFDDMTSITGPKPIILFDPASWKLEEIRGRLPDAQILDSVHGETLERHAIVIPGDMRSAFDSR